MRKWLPLLALLPSTLISSGCGTPKTDMSNLKPEERFNPAISATQRQHMMNRGPKTPG
jgi:hypothetical protein